MFDVAIIGGGFSGTSLVCQLPSDVSCIVFERSGNLLGKGLAYGIRSPHAILNVPAERMGVFERDHADFLKWLKSKGHNYNGDSFVPRKIYGEYLLERLKLSNHKTIVSEVTSISKTKNGFLLNDSIQAKNLVLATGNTESTLVSGERVVPISSLLNGAEVKGSKVCIIGSSLSAHDAVGELRGRSFDGEIVLVSRHGLSPKLHAGHNHAKIELDTSSLRALTRSVVANLKSTNDWRAGIDSLRPVTSKLWANLSEKDKEIFIRRLKTYWDIHRHRIPSESAHNFPTIKGNVVGTVEKEGKVFIQFSNRPEISAHYVIDATGVSWKEGNPLLLKLCEQGLAQLSFKGGGVKTTPDGRVIDKVGQPQKDVFAIGPIRRGDLLETTAVREIRTQAFNLANFFAQSSQSFHYLSHERT